MRQAERFPAGCVPNEFDERESRVLVVEPDEANGVTVRAWLSLPSGGRVPWVMVEAEDRDSRNRRGLPPDLARGTAEVLAELIRTRTAGPRPTSRRPHPGWCARWEQEGEPHRSRQRMASTPNGSPTVWVQLVHGEHHHTPDPATFVGIETDGQTLSWPPLSCAQHDALLSALLRLLDLLPPGESSPGANNPIGLPGSTRDACVD